MQYNPKKHHRRSIRLKGYDYSQAGLYFVTICTQNRACLFGDIINGEMILNDAGKMIEHWYYELKNKFDDIECHAMVVMPNHFHCIVQTVGADLRVCPNTAQTGEHNNTSGEHNNTSGDPDNTSGDPTTPSDEPTTPLGEHIGSPLPVIVQWFKTMTTNAYIHGVKNKGWQRFDGKLWQRNYWEHIIRNHNEYGRIAQYIIDNPKKWGNDKLNHGDGNRVMEPPAPYNTRSLLME